MTTPRHNRMLLLALAVVLGGLMCCGPVTTATTISDASRELKEARANDAEKSAPYEYTKAAAFLHKSKELEGHGLYEQSSTFARRSRTMSEKAIDVARESTERQKRKQLFGGKGSKKKKKRNTPSFTPSGK